MREGASGARVEIPKQAEETMQKLHRTSIPRGALHIAERLGKSGHGAWVVGGCVRDLLRGVPVSDWDLATSARPEEVQRLFRRTVPTGLRHGTVTVLEDGEGYEVTTLRGEGAYSDGRRPDSVSFVGSIEEDLGRRDFTVNAIAFDPVTEHVVDPWGGVADLERHVLRAVRDPMERFAEDGLRVLRAARFVATLEMTLDPETEAAIRPNLEVFAKVSRERVLSEWTKAFEKAARPSMAFSVMRRTGMLAWSAPPFEAQDDATFARGLARMDLAPRAFLPRLAALSLEAVDLRALEAWLLELRASNKDREDLVHLVRTFRKERLADADPLVLRRWIRDVGRPSLDRALSLRRIDAEARGEAGDADALALRVENELSGPFPVALSELALTGQDLLTELRLTPGRHIGELLKKLYEHTLTTPEDNERGRLLSLARTLTPPVG